MGNLLSYGNNHGSSGVESLDPEMAQTYRFPPKSGPYFANHFIMAGEKFDNMNPERFLFGENTDLNYLTNKPRNFPYQPPGPNDPSHPIRCLVHLRKESLKLVKEGGLESSRYTIEFIFDSDVACAVKIFMMASEDIANGTAKYTSRTPVLTSEPVLFSKGPKQTYSNSNYIIYPDHFQPSELNYVPGKGVEIPLVIQLTVEDPEFVGQSESTLAGIECLSDGGHHIKFMKQKLMIDGFCLIAQEIYGIDNKTIERGLSDDEDMQGDDSTECMICMSSLRDTMLLPCRHLYACRDCAENIRTQQSTCSICRGSFHALLQIKGVRRKSNNTSDGEAAYEEFSIINALTGNIDKENDTSKLSKTHRQSSARSTRSSNRSRSGRSSRSRRSIERRLPSDTNALPSQESAIVTPAVACTDECGNVADIDVVGESAVKTPDLKPSTIKKIHAVIKDAHENGKEDLDETNEHVDPSLPGTPMGSDKSVDSFGHSLTGSTTMLLATSSNSLYSTSVQVTALKVNSKPAAEEEDEKA